MAVTLNAADADFEARFTAFLATKREVSADVEAVVRDIIARVRAEGDEALIDYTQRFDKADLGTLGIACGQDGLLLGPVTLLVRYGFLLIGYILHLLADAFHYGGILPGSLKTLHFVLQGRNLTL